MSQEKDRLASEGASRGPGLELPPDQGGIPTGNRHSLPQGSREIGDGIQRVEERQVTGAHRRSKHGRRPNVFMDSARTATRSSSSGRRRSAIVTPSV
jgi:hypothetical protein